MSAASPIFPPAPARRAITYGMVSTFPPTPCGVATFSQALSDGLGRGGDEVEVIAVGSVVGPEDPRVVARLDDRQSSPAPEAIDALNATDVVVLQHEYGIYAGEDGDSVLTVLDRIDRPTIVVAHTVLNAPTPHQRSVLEAVTDAADAVVVMTEAGRRRLCTSFGVAPWKVTVVPHGAAVSTDPGTSSAGTGPALTWGLLGPGKGIEWAIDAVGLLGDMGLSMQYLIAGDTHPKVHAVHGDAYLDMLRERVRRGGLESAVRFDGGYRDTGALGDLIRSASFVILPYDSPDQVTSGVLVDAIAAGRPVIATAFPHAQELLSTGAGLVVERRDPGALADAVRRVLTEPGLREGMAAEAARLAPGLAWSAVASRYAAISSALLEGRLAVGA